MRTLLNLTLFTFFLAQPLFASAEEPEIASSSICHRVSLESLTTQEIASAYKNFRTMVGSEDDFSNLLDIASAITPQCVVPGTTIEPGAYVTTNVSGTGTDDLMLSNLDLSDRVSAIKKIIFRRIVGGTGIDNVDDHGPIPPAAALTAACLPGGVVPIDECELNLCQLASLLLRLEFDGLHL